MAVDVLGQGFGELVEGYLTGVFDRFKNSFPEEVLDEIDFDSVWLEVRSVLEEVGVFDPAYEAQDGLAKVCSAKLGNNYLALMQRIFSKREGLVSRGNKFAQLCFEGVGLALLEAFECKHSAMPVPDEMNLTDEQKGRVLLRIKRLYGDEEASDRIFADVRGADGRVYRVGESKRQHYVVPVKDDGELDRANLRLVTGFNAGVKCVLDQAA